MADSEEGYRVVTFILPGVKSGSLSYASNTKTDEAYCAHVHSDADKLRAFVEASTTVPCPTCASSSSMQTFGADGKDEIEDGANDVLVDLDTVHLDEYFFDLLNSPRDWTAPDELTPEMLYGTHDSVFVSGTKRWTGRYSDFGIPEKFVHARGTVPSATFELSYTIFEPKRPLADNVKMPTMFLTHGVPMNRREWDKIARLLGRFMRVITVDLLGMGESSMPLDFWSATEMSRDGRSPKSHWSWGTQCDMFHAMFHSIRTRHPSWFLNGKAFFGANDWGSAVVQKFAERYSTDLLGAGIFSAIALNGYWVQHIGSLQALAMLPYPSPTFTAETVRFAGVLTSLLETMFHRTAYHINQYSMAPYQFPYVEISYDNVDKNPGNTVYKEHAVRVLAQQAAAALGNGELLPYHSMKNPNGMHFSKWNVPILVMWGRQDKMMPEAQRHRFALIAAHIAERRRAAGRIKNRLWLREVAFEEAGHFAIRDQPLKSAHAMLTWVRDITGSLSLALPFIGFEGIARQDEQHLMKILSKDYKSSRAQS